jgi:ThiF family
MRPMLRPGLRHAWLTPDTLQIGIDVPRPLVVSDLPVLGHALLARIDGVRSRTEVITGLVRDGVDTSGGAQSEALLDRLTQLGAVVDGGEWPQQLTPVTVSDPESDASRPSHPWRRLLSTRVTIRGAGRLGGVVARSLSAAGVGAVAVDDERTVTPADLAPGGFTYDEIGHPRTIVATDRRPRPLVTAQQLVVVTDEVDLLTECRTLNRDAVPHLVVTCRELIGRIGPFVVPGQTSCQLCLELSRRDREAHYAVVWRQRLRQPHPECEPLLAAVTANIAASHVVSWAAGDSPPSLDALLEVVSPDASVRRQTTRAHPECGCAWPGSAA